MVLDFFKRGTDSIGTVEEMLVQMMRDGRVVYDAAMGAVFGGGKSAETKAEVKDTDRGINAAQRDVRKALILHSAVTPETDLALVLTYMSVVKDAERIGDYAKNIYDLAKYGVNFDEAEDLAELEHYRDAVGRLMDEAAEAFASHDADRAQQLVDKADAFLDEYDAKVQAAYRSDGPASDAVARTLYYRYLKRITAHVMNLMTSLVMPIDRLDYYDEDKVDRG